MPRSHALILVLALVAVASRASAATPDWAHPRTLPSLVREWRFDIVPCGIEVREGTVYAFDRARW